jgi:hypothetical protein
VGAKEGRAQIAELLVASDSRGRPAGMRGEENPPAIYRVETLDNCVARVNLSWVRSRTAKRGSVTKNQEQVPGQRAPRPVPGSARRENQRLRRPARKESGSGDTACHRVFSAPGQSRDHPAPTVATQHEPTDAGVACATEGKSEGKRSIAGKGPATPCPEGTPEGQGGSIAPAIFIAREGRFSAGRL